MSLYIICVYIVNMVYFDLTYQCCLKYIEKLQNAFITGYVSDIENQLIAVLQD